MKKTQTQAVAAVSMVMTLSPWILGNTAWGGAWAQLQGSAGQTPVAVAAVVNPVPMRGEPGSGFFTELASISDRLASFGFRPRFGHVGMVRMALFERGRSRRAAIDPATADRAACAAGGEPWVVTGVRIVMAEGRKDYPRGMAWVVTRLCTPGAEVGYSEDFSGQYSSLGELRAGTRDFQEVKDMAETLERLIAGTGGAGTSAPGGRL